jgi:hypothetical protein
MAGASYAIPANSAQAGTTYEINGVIYFTRGATVTALTITTNLTVAGVTQQTTGATPAHVTASATNGRMSVRGRLTILTTGAGGTAVASLIVYEAGVRTANSTAVTDISATATPAAFTFNTTIANTLDVVTGMGVAVAGCTLTVPYGVIERLAVN